ncbi:MAG: DUF3575 domain-containing protein [Bacteroidetes bacterium]|nr:DUF3575 domain-containing protein [Bacteroidota bacterium]
MIAKKITLILLTLMFPLAGLQALEKNDTIEKSKKHEKNDTIEKVKMKEKFPPLKPYHWNVIKFNPTPMLLWSNVNNITFSYERLVAKNHSVSLQAGYLLFPRLITDTIAGIITIEKGKKYGINLALDYRYYPFSRNRRPAPDGLYIGAFISYYGFHFKNNFDILYTTVDQNAAIEGNLNILNIGMSLGYQFIFWKRLSLDLLMFGPSVSLYKGDLKLSGSLDPDQIENIDQELVDKLLNRFPLLKSIFSSENLEFTGSRASWSLGFRYSIQIGFHF